MAADSFNSSGWTRGGSSVLHVVIIVLIFCAQMRGPFFPFLTHQPKMYMLNSFKRKVDMMWKTHCNRGIMTQAPHSVVSGDCFLGLAFSTHPGSGQQMRLERTGEFS